MIKSNPIKSAFSSAMSSAGFMKKSDTWYRESVEAILVVNLQKSDFGPRYYVNLAVWLKAVDDATFPKEHQCHIRLRATDLDSERARYWEREVFDLETEMPDRMRGELITSLLRTKCVPFLHECSSLDGLKRMYAEGRLAPTAIWGEAARRMVEG